VWALIKEQARNRRSNRRFEYEGKDRAVAEISEMAGVKYNALYHLLAVRGMAAGDAVNELLRR
jgi:hypothetical protein